MKRKRRGISAGVRWRVFKRDGFKCVYCGESSMLELVIDHGDPFARGGDDHEDNYVTACRLCNAGKRDKIIIPPAADGCDWVPTGDELTVRGVSYKSQLHADWADALRQAATGVAYMPQPERVEEYCGERWEIVRADFECHFFDPQIGDANVVILPRADHGLMGDSDRRRARNAALLGYTKPTAIIIGSPWFFYGIVINERYKGCPAGFALDGRLRSRGEVYLSGWYPDECWTPADPRDFEQISPKTCEHVGWHKSPEELWKEVHDAV